MREERETEEDGERESESDLKQRTALSRWCNYSHGESER